MTYLTMKGFNKTTPPIWLCFTANTANSTVQLTQTGSPTSVTLEKSTDGNIWNSYTIGDTITLSNIGDKVYIRNTSETDTGFSIDSGNYYQFVMTGSIAGSGDTNSLLNKTSTTTIPNSACFMYLFKNCTSLTTAPKLPATTLADTCYYQMFYGCSNLTTAPDLPAMTVPNSCYGNMFRTCTSLIKAPELPATTLGEQCYSSMFYGCTSLTTAPLILPATTLKPYCYQYMFYNCRSLKNAPVILATTLAGHCCTYMFGECYTLEQLPRLSATKLANYCYYYMFSYCSKIKLSTTQTGEYTNQYRIPTTGTGTTASNALQYMFDSTGGTFAGTPSINTTYYTSNTLV